MDRQLQLPAKELGHIMQVPGWDTTKATGSRHTRLDFYNEWAMLSQAFGENQCITVISVRDPAMAAAANRVIDHAGQLPNQAAVERRSSSSSTAQHRRHASLQPQKMIRGALGYEILDNMTPSCDHNLSDI